MTHTFPGPIPETAGEQQGGEMAKPKLLVFQIAGVIVQFALAIWG